MAPFWTASSTVLPGCAQTSLKHLSTCMEDVLHVLLFLHCFAACLSSSCLVSVCLLLSMENHSLSSKKKFMACTSHVSHPFDSVHVLFVALYCVKCQETYRGKKSFFSRRVAATQWGQRSYQGTCLLYSNSARVRKCSRAHTHDPK